MKFRITTGAVLLALASLGCSSGGAEDYSESASATEATAAAPEVEGQTLEFKGGSIQFEKGVELLAKVDHESGNQLFFVRADNSWTVMEAAQVGNPSLVSKRRSPDATLLTEFHRLAPNKPVPAPLLKAAEELGHTDDLSSQRIEQQPTRDSIQLEPGQDALVAPEHLGTGTSTPAPNMSVEGQNGLQATSNFCWDEWFTDTYCVGLRTENGAIPTKTHYGTSITEPDYVSFPDVTEGASSVCTDLGSITWTVGNTRRVIASVNIDQAIAMHSGYWEEVECSRNCWPSWECSTWCIRKSVTGYSNVTNLSQGGQFHHCGYMD